MSFMHTPTNSPGGGTAFRKVTTLTQLVSLRDHDLRTIQSVVKAQRDITPLCKDATTRLVPRYIRLC